MEKKKKYFLGLDIGTDSIGWAVTDEKYQILKYKGKSMWGSGLFDAATPSATRRTFRTARRRLDRRQQRVRLLQEFFAREIEKVDPGFFVRLRESALFREDRTNPHDNQTLFNDPSFKDADYHNKYPTIHHLIVDLMDDPSAHDPRLVYIACAWLMAHRGHFLSEIDIRNVASLDDVSTMYNNLMSYLEESIKSEDDEDFAIEPLWICNPSEFGNILAANVSVSKKKELMLDLLFNGKKPRDSDEARYGRFEIISMLCGGKVSPSAIFKSRSEEYAEFPSFSLADDEEKLESIISELGDDGELIRILKSLYDWGVLCDVRKGCTRISEAKVKVYEQHKKDLSDLKAFLKKYDKNLYKTVFLDKQQECNYVAYIGNAISIDRKSLKEEGRVSTATKEKFCDWLKRAISGIKIEALEEGDRAFYEEMMSRLDTCTFLPKQKNSDNRVIPYQLYQVELKRILENSSRYLSFLNERDEYGSVAEKIESIFVFRIPYFVGPLVSAGRDKGKFAWMIRKKEGMIRPWNFDELVDLDRSEDEFIRRMTNTCEYFPGEDVLPACSLIYEEFKLLNEINPMKISGAAITPEVKMGIVNELFKKRKKVGVAQIERYLLQNGIMHEGDILEGVDEQIKSSLVSYHNFKGWLDKKILSESDVEQIVLRSTCTNDSVRLKEWLKKQPFSSMLDDAAIRKIASFKCTEFGRLSRRLVDGIKFDSHLSGEKGTVIEFMRRENVTLMELLSSRYSLGRDLERIRCEYYAAHPLSLDARLDEMYVSSVVKRQIYRALDVVKTVKKAMGCTPEKVFVEMARGGQPEEKGKRTKSRYDQLLEKFKYIKTEEVREINSELLSMGDGGHSRLQSDALFLRYLQLGRCAYCGRSISVEEIKSVADIDHILPQFIVKDDSILNNKVFCCKNCNGSKGDAYPVPDGLRNEALWGAWHRMGLMTDEKYNRLMRRTQLTESELQGFINRQLVETRQTTKAVFAILQELLPESEIIAVKAGNVSDVRHHFKSIQGMVKSRSINDLHHAKDAFLNIVVGNVYHERFTRAFNISSRYSMKVATIFGDNNRIENRNGVAWAGVDTIKVIKGTMVNDDGVNLTKYQIYAKGGFFDQMPKGPASGEIQRKNGLEVEKYGGYAKPSAVGFVLVRYFAGNKKDIMIVPVNLIDVSAVMGEDEAKARELVSKIISQIDKKFTSLDSDPFPIGRRILRVNTRLHLDGFPYVITGKSGGGKLIGIRSFQPLGFSKIEENGLSQEDYEYIKRLESTYEKIKKNSKLVISEEYDKISSVKNQRLYGRLMEVASSSVFGKMPASQADVLRDGRSAFSSLEVGDQIAVLLQIVLLLKTNRPGTCDLSLIGGVKKAGGLAISSKVSNWKSKYSDARIVDMDFTGLHSRESVNLLSLL